MSIGNVNQAAAWDGPEGERWATDHLRYERTTQRHRQQLLITGIVTRTNDVLDVGCGAGRLSRDVARISATGSVLGVDLSKRMLEAARAASSAEHLLNVDFKQADAQVHPFEPGSVDAVVSCFGTTFFADPVAAFSNLARTMRPASRIGMLAWREAARNEWIAEIQAAFGPERAVPEPQAHAPGPFGLADLTYTRSVLTRAGLVDVDFSPIEEAVDFGANVDEAFGFVPTLGIARGLATGLTETAVKRAHERLKTAIAAHATSDGVLFGFAAWLITARRA